jgi:flagellar motor protein MotB
MQANFRTILAGRAERVACAAVMLGALGGGCAASQPSRDLVRARQAYARAASNSAAELAPARLSRAREALERAEFVHEQDPGSGLELHLAYMALRKSEIAIASGGIAAAVYAEREANRNYEAALRERSQRAHREELAALRERELVAHAEATRLRSEQEHRASAALAGLSSVASVTRHERSVVIALPSALLFAGRGHDEVARRAEPALERVARALAAQPPDSLFLIEGHTAALAESHASAELGARRAELVRDHLIERGLDPRRVETHGHAAAELLSDDRAQVEREAANPGRVEIIVLPQGGLTARAGP